MKYSDAVRILKGVDSTVVAALDAVAGGLLLAATPLVPALSGWLDAKTEFVRLSAQLVQRVGRRREGSRYTRTQRLQAAHAVIVVSAFFEALDELPVPLRTWDLSRDEQLAIATGTAQHQRAALLIESLFAVGDVLPDASAAVAGNAGVLAYYGTLATNLVAFVGGLAAWEDLDDSRRTAYAQAVRDVPARAYERYEERCRQLAVDAPEMARWLDVLEHRTTRSAVRGALADLRQTLRELSTGATPTEQVAAIGRAAAAALTRPIIEVGDVPVGVRVPALEDVYVAPLCRTVVVRTGTDVSDEAQWSALPLREDLQDVLGHVLHAPASVTAPLLVLGQPGSGKSVLTTILAARLPAGDYVAVRVPLREVAATGDVQDQIETAVRKLTGERISWPALVRGAGGALPVVLLDGFDELLQATAVSQSDYLVRVAAFQQRELDQGRPVIVVVTSRITVTHRVAVPDGTVAIRLEPFDERRIKEWLIAWNGLNRAYFANNDVLPLTEDVALQHADLAAQPLLLLMLALYDANDNALQRLGGGLHRTDLYEGLIGSFVRREVAKHQAGLVGPELDRVVEAELRRLSVVAFAMFNRSSQSVTAAELNADLDAVYGEPGGGSPAGMRAPLRPAEAVLGRFFFVHRSQALRDDSALATYEFLHATFAEFLVARMTMIVLRETAAQARSAARSFTPTRIDDDLMHALLSFAVLTVRAPVLVFLASLFDRIPADERGALAEVLGHLLRAAHVPRRPGAFEGYRPAPPHVAGAYGRYSANLLLLAVCASPGIAISTLYGRTGMALVVLWKQQTSLWRSQVGSEALTNFIQALSADRVRTPAGRDVLLSIDPSTPTPPVDLSWTYGLETTSGDTASQIWTTRDDVTYWSRRAHVMTRLSDDVAQHLMEPVERSLGPLVPKFTVHHGHIRSVAATLLDALLPADGPDRAQRYLDCAAAFGVVRHSTDLRPYVTALLGRIATDDRLTARDAATVLEQLSTYDADAVLRCCLAHLGHDVQADEALADLIGRAVVAATDATLVADACVRLREVGLSAVFTREHLVKLAELPEVARARPDLLARARALHAW